MIQIRQTSFFFSSSLFGACDKSTPGHFSPRVSMLVAVLQVTILLLLGLCLILELLKKCIWNFFVNFGINIANVGIFKKKFCTELTRGSSLKSIFRFVFFILCWNSFLRFLKYFFYKESLGRTDNDICTELLQIFRDWLSQCWQQSRRRLLKNRNYE